MWWVRLREPYSYEFFGGVAHKHCEEVLATTIVPPPSVLLERVVLSKRSGTEPTLEAFKVQLQAWELQVRNLGETIRGAFMPYRVAEDRRMWKHIDEAKAKDDALLVEELVAQWDLVREEAKAKDEAFNRERWFPYDQSAWDRYERAMALEIKPTYNAARTGLHTLAIPEELQLHDPHFAQFEEFLGSIIRKFDEKIINFGDYDQVGYAEFYRAAQDYYIELDALVDNLGSTFWSWRREIDKDSATQPPVDALKAQVETLRDRAAELQAAMFEGFTPAFAAEMRRHEITGSVTVQDHALNQERQLPYDQLAWDRFKLEVASKLMPSFKAICEGLEALHIPELSTVSNVDLGAISGLVADAGRDLKRIETLLAGNSSRLDWKFEIG
jgi:hypothetical protein